MTTVRLARFLARAGACSRRGAVDLLADGRVLVNGRAPVGPGDPIDPAADRVTLDGRPLALVAAQWLALYKPVGYVTSRAATTRHASVFDLVPRDLPGLVPVGRLDVMSEGLLLWTTDGDAAHRLMHPRWQVPRTYAVSVNGVLDPQARAALDRGVRLPDESRPVVPRAWAFRAIGKGGELTVELAEGRSRVVRRVCAQLGLGIRRLIRTAYGPVALGDLPAGTTRGLRSHELDALCGAIGLPSPITPHPLP